MRILTRYILKEVLSHALIGGALFTFILFMRDLGRILELVVRNSASLTSVLEVFLLTLPNTFTVTIPMAVLVGILLGLGRLAADSEITAMRASGIGVWTFVRIISAVAVFAFAIGLVNSLFLAPKSAQALLNLENSLKNSQASFEVQPRVFYEDFKNYVLYVQDVKPASESSNWRRIFLADLSNPSSPKVTTAESATVVSGDDQTVRMRLRNGSQHESQTNDPGQYSISTFSDTDLPVQIGTQSNTRKSRSETPLLAMSNRALLEKSKGPGGKWYLIELNKRFAYPAACLVLMLIGVPLGVSSKRGGKSAGFVLTIALVFLYYFLSSTGVALGRQNKLPVFIGVWMANFVFAFCGLLLLRQMATGGRLITMFSSLYSRGKEASSGESRRGACNLVAFTAPSRGKKPLSAHSRRLCPTGVHHNFWTGADQLRSSSAGLHVF